MQFSVSPQDVGAFDCNEPIATIERRAAEESLRKVKLTRCNDESSIPDLNPLP